MSERTVYEETLINVLRTVAISSIPLYEIELEQLANMYYPDDANMAALHDVVFPQLRELVDMVENPNILFHELREVHTQGSSEWFHTPVDPQLIVHLDMILDRIYHVFKNVEDEIMRLQHKLCRADFVADLFSVVTRDIGGGALELQHRVSPPHVGQNSPHRVYYEFHQRSASRLAVIAAIEKRLKNEDLEPFEYLDLRYAIQNIHVEDELINVWLNNLVNIYRDVANKYAINNLDDFIGYIREKQTRNADSHFNDWIKLFIPSQQNRCGEFVDNDPVLRMTFANGETDLLERTFERCTVDLRANPSLNTGSYITVTSRKNPQNRYNAHFMREMDPFNIYRIAANVVTVENNGQQRRQPEYWNPQKIDANDYTIEFGHRCPY